MAEKLLQHKHCTHCGLAVNRKDEYCSDECRNAHETMIKKKKNQLLMFYIGSVIVIVILVILSFGGK